MGLGGDLASGCGSNTRTTKRGTRSDACGIEVAKVHVITLYPPSPTGSCQSALGSVAEHPTGINLRGTEGLGDRARRGQGEARSGKACKATCVCSIYLDLAVGQTASDVGQHLSVTPHITNAATHCAEPIYFCRIARNCGVRTFCAREVTERVR